MSLRNLLLVFTLLLGSTPAALASQGSCILPTSGTVSGLTLVQNINTCIDAIQTANSGATAPSNIGPTLGMLWLDTSTNDLKIYDSASWLRIGHVDSSGGIWNAPIGGGTATLASATTTDLCSIPQALITISGTTTISSFSNTCIAGTVKPLIFSGVLTLTNNVTSMILPNGGSNITTAAGDRAWAVYLGAGNWNVIAYQKADGTSLSTLSIFTGAVFLSGPISPTALGGNTNNWAPTGFSGSNVVRVSASSAVNLTGLAGGADGRMIYLRNVGSFNVTLTSLDSSSTAGNQFAIPQKYILRPNEAITLIYDGTSTKWYAPTLYQAKTPTVQILTSGSGATYTTPAGATYIIAKAIAGGGGGGGTSSTGGTGGTTTFNSVNAIGGTGGGQASGTIASVAGGIGGTGGTGSATFRIPGAAGGASTGATNSSCGNAGVGGSGPYGGAGAIPAQTTCATVAGGSAVANTGAGGSGAGGGVNTPGAGGGGVGEYFELMIGGPAATYTYTVGAAGTAGTGTAGGTGGSGRIEVWEFYN